MLSSILQYLLHSTEAYLGLIRTSAMECFFTKNVVVRLGSKHVSEVMESTCYKVMVSIEMNGGIDKCSLEQISKVLFSFLCVKKKLGLKKKQRRKSDFYLVSVQKHNQDLPKHQKWKALKQKFTAKGI